MIAPFKESEMKREKKTVKKKLNGIKREKKEREKEKKLMAFPRRLQSQDTECTHFYLKYGEGVFQSVISQWHVNM